MTGPHSAPRWTSENPFMEQGGRNGKERGRRFESVRGLRGSLACECSAGGGRDVGVRVGLTGDAPAALRRLGQEHPCALGQARVAGGASNDLRDFLDDTELFVAV
jgi:hypothetical protein